LVEIRKANVGDAAAIQKIVNGFADRGEMLHRSLSELYENIRDYFVADKDGEVIGCCALHVSWEDLAEVKSLAVAEDYQGEGLGRKLVERCLEEAREIGVRKVFALTYKPKFFESLGFRLIDKNDLPRKIWTECINCPKYPDCGEEALLIVL
jgi:amino-acid N-acetyltransferase